MHLENEDLYKLLISFVLGLIIGFEREYRSKSAGLRTMILISVGTTLFTILSIKISADAGRIAANILTGIGFIGAGIIFRENNRVVGITTAAIVWVTAALGMGIGAGYYYLSIACFIISGFSLVILSPLQNMIRRYNQIRNYRLMCVYDKQALTKYEDLFLQYDLKILRSEQSKTGSHISGNWILQGTEKAHMELTNRLLNDNAVVEFDF